jgi:hypothetical protein
MILIQYGPGSRFQVDESMGRFLSVEAEEMFATRETEVEEG